MENLKVGCLIIKQANTNIFILAKSILQLRKKKFDVLGYFEYYRRKLQK